MRKNRLLPLALLGLIASGGIYGTALAIPPDQGLSTRAPDNNFHGFDASAGPGSFLTPHARAVYMLDAARATKGMSPRQAAHWRRQQHRRFVDMTADQRDRFQTRLQRRWDHLSPHEKHRLSERLANAGTQRDSGLR